MKALVFTAIKEQQLLDVPTPAIDRPDGVLLKVKSVGVCGSDLHGYTGQSGRRVPPLIMGHEVTAEVVEVGATVKGLPLGSRVAIQPVEFCGVCPQCLAGRRNVCEKRRLMGMNVPGAYAEYVTWPASNLFQLPDILSYEDGALAEPLSVAVHAVSLAHIRPYDTALVVGAGPIGLLTLAVLKLTGLSRIAVSDTSDARLELARELGAQVTINPTQQNARQVVNEFTNGGGVDLAFEAVGISATAQQSLEVTRNNGTVVWIGNNQRLIEVDMQAIVTRELRVIGSYGMNDEDFQRSLRLLADGRIPTGQLINRRASLSEGPTLFDQLLASPETIKCMINFE
ncbi:MAG: galactitol-1-phosphate 5-dehydrogenase [Anaerolineae bacterium]|nr:galactitol-1-phosphate 5-dehydrogenase [Anaerolineales bacterium]MCQ3980244.1 galactitol-1-phosphate 5-dehydrogenase [Anaerolineae bacterium]